MNIIGLHGGGSCVPSASIETRTLDAGSGAACPDGGGAFTTFVAWQCSTLGFMKNHAADLTYRPSARGPETKTARPGLVSRTIAYAFVVAIGSGAAGYYSNAFPIAGCVILFGGVWFALWALFSLRGRAALGSLLRADILLELILFALPPILMIFASRSFSRGTGHITTNSPSW